MATAEEVRLELAKAEKELEDAKAALKEFNEGRYGDRLTVLENKLWSDEGTEEQRAEWKVERARLEEQQKQLKAAVETCIVVWAKWNEELLKRGQEAQPGNDFVTRALGT